MERLKAASEENRVARSTAPGRVMKKEIAEIATSITVFGGIIGTAIVVAYLLATMLLGPIITPMWLIGAL